jgi:peptidoglycan/xylan/chitin deacetylase (PgdA/CDA1 family)
MLTFDIEDFINPNAIDALQITLEMLNKYKLRAIFFITGHMSEKLSNYPKILDLLENHKIGFHSSSHSVRPIIAEYTNVENYHQAYSISLERETSHINPLTGKVEGKGGIYFLQDLFHPRKIEAYRAPGMSWTPPHLEALAKLGIKYDFSSNITLSEPVHYQGIVFYPDTFTQQWEGSLYNYQCLFAAILKRKIAILDIHPTIFVNQNMWDIIYYKGNPKTLQRAHERPLKETRSLFKKFELLLKQINLLRHAKLIEVDPNLNTQPKDLTVSKNEVQKYYETSMRWPTKRFNFKPRYIRDHFHQFFEAASR